MTPDEDASDAGQSSATGGDAGGPEGAGGSGPVGRSPERASGDQKGVGAADAPRTSGKAGSGRPPAGRAASGRPPVRMPGERQGHPGDAWNTLGTLVAGMAFWGFVGFGVDRLLGFQALFLPIGLTLGIAASMYLVIYRFGRR